MTEQTIRELLESVRTGRQSIAAAAPTDTLSPSIVVNSS